MHRLDSTMFRWPTKRNELLRHRCAALAALFLVCCAPRLAGAAALDLGVHYDDQAPGYRFLIERQYIPPLLDQEVFDNLWRTWEEPQQSRAQAADAPTRRALTMSRYGFTEAPGRAGGVPLQFATSTSNNGWSVNCFFCHGGKLLGQSLPGLPNSHVAMQTFYDEVAAAKQLLGREVPPIPEKLRVPLGGSNGTTNAIIFGVLLGSQRDAQLNYRPHHPVPKLIHNDHDAPAWWYVGKKTHLYADAHSPKDHRAIMAFMMDPAVGPQQFQDAEDDYRVILAWMEQLSPPRWPWGFDQTLAARGASVFASRCAECHGTYGADGSYPNHVAHLDEVGTDRARLDSIAPYMRLGAQFTWFGDFGKKKMVISPVGYIAPPLDGIWASAPYLHNGSVPTLWHLFHPDQRPVVWQRSENGYDQQKIGLEVTTFASLPSDVTDARVQRTYFDSRLFGKSNAGHLFPSELNDSEKQAVLEYLKTL